ncbi:MAG: nitroreductase family protein [Alphaproteobacteria bacterium]|nr:nitroreductase family protein [Alphaproteobacteria bacterium]
MTNAPARIADHPIDRQFLERWSPRALSGDGISQAELDSLFEAARWAPSSYNSQPWRIVYGRRGTPHFDALLGLLNDFNRSWAQRAATIAIVVSAKNFTPPSGGAPQPSRTHAFDTGAAWGYLALQAHNRGWYAHGIAGFDLDRARTELGVPDDHEVQIALAIGKLGDKNDLPEPVRAREVPSGRRPIREWTFEGRLG